MNQENILLQIRFALAKEPKIAGAYVLGSVVSGKIHKESDFDLAVVIKNKQKTTINQIYDLLSPIRFPKDLDLSLIDKNSSPLFLFQVVSIGQCIFFRSENERIEFESFVASNYYDTAHLRSIYYHALKHKFPYAT